MAEREEKFLKNITHPDSNFEYNFPEAAKLFISRVLAIENWI